jgi:hypothetical protein
MEWFYDKDGKGKLCGEKPQGYFDTPFGRDTNETAKSPFVEEATPDVEKIKPAKRKKRLKNE